MASYQLVATDKEKLLPSSGSSSSFEETNDVELEETILDEKPHHRHHREDHFERPEIVRDAILGLSDGLTVPFALAAGLSSLGDSKVVIYGGVAELVSGAISMGLGGFLAAKSEAEHFDAEKRREEREVELYPEEEEDEIVEIFGEYGLTREAIEPMFKVFRQNPDKFVDFMMKFELNLERPDPNRSWISAVTIGTSYFLGGLIPLLPYFFVDNTTLALYLSVILTSITLLIFGFVKSLYLNPLKALYSALQTLTIGGAAAASSYLVVYMFQAPDNS